MHLQSLKFGLVLSIFTICALLLIDLRTPIPGLLAGTCIGGINIIAITFLVQRLIGAKTQSQPAFLALLVLVKFLFLAFAVYVMIVRFRLSGLGFLIGYSIMLFSAVGNVIFKSRMRTEKEDGNVCIKH